MYLNVELFQVDCTTKKERNQMNKVIVGLLLLGLAVPTLACDITGPQGPVGPQGPAGKNGTNGTNGVNGVNGKAGINGVNGQNAQDESSVSMAVDTAVRLYDSKYIQLQAFNMYAGRDGDTFGARLVVKLGSSYEERQLKALRLQLDALRGIIANHLK